MTAAVPSDSNPLVGPGAGSPSQIPGKGAKAPKCVDQSQRNYSVVDPSSKLKVKEAKLGRMFRLGAAAAASNQHQSDLEALTRGCEQISPELLTQAMVNVTGIIESVPLEPGSVKPEFAERATQDVAHALSHIETQGTERYAGKEGTAAVDAHQQAMGQALNKLRSGQKLQPQEKRLVVSYLRVQSRKVAVELEQAKADKGASKSSGGGKKAGAIAEKALDLGGRKLQKGPAQAGGQKTSLEAVLKREAASKAEEEGLLGEELQFLMETMLQVEDLQRMSEPVMACLADFQFLAGAGVHGLGAATSALNAVAEFKGVRNRDLVAKTIAREKGIDVSEVTAKEVNTRAAWEINRLDRQLMGACEKGAVAALEGIRALGMIADGLSTLGGTTLVADVAGVALDGASVAGVGLGAIVGPTNIALNTYGAVKSGQKLIENRSIRKKVDKFMSQHAASGVTPAKQRMVAAILVKTNDSRQECLQKIADFQQESLGSVDPRLSDPDSFPLKEAMSDLKAQEPSDKGSPAHQAWMSAMESHVEFSLVQFEAQKVLERLVDPDLARESIEIQREISGQPPALSAMREAAGQPDLSRIPQELVESVLEAGVESMDADVAKPAKAAVKDLRKGRRTCKKALARYCKKAKIDLPDASDVGELSRAVMGSMGKVDPKLKGEAMEVLSELTDLDTKQKAAGDLLRQIGMALSVEGKRGVKATAIKPEEALGVLSEKLPSWDQQLAKFQLARYVNRLAVDNMASGIVDLCKHGGCTLGSVLSTVGFFTAAGDFGVTASVGAGITGAAVAGGFAANTAYKVGAGVSRRISDHKEGGKMSTEERELRSQVKETVGRLKKTQGKLQSIERKIYATGLKGMVARRTLKGGSQTDEQQRAQADKYLDQIAELVESYKADSQQLNRLSAEMNDKRFSMFTVPKLKDVVSQTVQIARYEVENDVVTDDFELSDEMDLHEVPYTVFFASILMKDDMNPSIGSKLAGAAAKAVKKSKVVDPNSLEKYLPGDLGKKLNYRDAAELMTQEAVVKTVLARLNPSKIKGTG